MEKKKSLSSNIKKEKLLKNKLKNKDWAEKLRKATGKTIDSTTRPKIKFGQVYLLIDCSGSMYGDKIEQAKNGALGFADEALSKNYSVGVITFSSKANHLLEPEKSMHNIKAAIEKFTASGSTNMTAAIKIATQNLEDRFGEKLICIVTDGMPDNKKSALKAAETAKQKGIEIMTIGTDDADKKFLEQLATKKELSVKVERSNLGKGITDMARLLPNPKRR